MFRFELFELEITRNALLSLIRNGLIVSDRVNPLGIGRKFSLSVLLLLVDFCLIFVNLNALDVKYSKLAFDLDLTVDWSDVVDVTQHSEVILCATGGDSNEDVGKVSDGGGGWADVNTVVFRLCSIFKYRTVISRISAFSSFVGRVPCVTATVFFNRISLSVSNESLMRARRFFSINGFRFFKRTALNFNDGRLGCFCSTGWLLRLFLLDFNDFTTVFEFSDIFTVFLVCCFGSK